MFISVSAFTRRALSLDTSLDLLLLRLLLLLLMCLLTEKSARYVSTKLVLVSACELPLVRIRNKRGRLRHEMAVGLDFGDLRI